MNTQANLIQTQEGPAESMRPLTQPSAAADSPHLGRRRLILPGVVISALVALGFYLYVPGLYTVTTDDAYVDAHVVAIVPKVAAYVLALHVDDNTKVDKDGLLVELDPRDFRVALQGARADLESAHANAANVTAQMQEQQATIVQSEAALEGSRSTLEFARQELQRYDSAARTGFGTIERFQQAQADIGQRESAVKRDLAALDAARAHMGVLETEQHQVQAVIDQKRAAVAQAALNLSYTNIDAVEAGAIANKAVEVGNFVQPGQVLFSLVPRTPYVTANFKETQLAHVRPGQPATIRVDAFPGLRLRGHVDSLQAGTGSKFALLPPENATGNFVKVVQRVPVKIVLDNPNEAQGLIAPGMSVEAKITFATPPGWLAWLD
jgi:membrane fusion protein (multidrug efflux system)